MCYLNIKDDSKIIEHMKNNVLTGAEFLEVILCSRKINDEEIKEIKQIFITIYDSHYYLASQLFNELVKNDNNVLIYFQKFSKQFYPKFVSKGLSFYQNQYSELADFIYNSEGIDELLSLLDEKDEIIKEMLQFYDIVANYLIRFFDFSIIGSSKQKCIITSSQNCDKKFYDYLKEGFSLYRLQKVGFDNSSNSFYCLPVLPTRDLGFPIQEYIETYAFDSEIEGKQMVKILSTNK